jgi:hypothetical protein
MDRGAALDSGGESSGREERDTGKLKDHFGRQGNGIWQSGLIFALGKPVETR